MKIIIFEFFVLIEYFLFIISILGILDLAHRKKILQAIVHCTMYIVTNSAYVYYNLYIYKPGSSEIFTIVIKEQNCPSQVNGKSWSLLNQFSQKSIRLVTYPNYILRNR